MGLPLLNRGAGTGVMGEAFPFPIAAAPYPSAGHLG